MICNTYVKTSISTYISTHFSKKYCTLLRNKVTGTMEKENIVETISVVASIVIITEKELHKGFSIGDINSVSYGI